METYKLKVDSTEKLIPKINKLKLGKKENYQGEIELVGALDENKKRTAIYKLNIGADGQGNNDKEKAYYWNVSRYGANGEVETKLENNDMKYTYTQTGGYTLAEVAPTIADEAIAAMGEIIGSHNAKILLREFNILAKTADQEIDRRGSLSFATGAALKKKLREIQETVKYLDPESEEYDDLMFKIQQAKKMLYGG